jgi:hypothetical protein
MESKIKAIGRVKIQVFDENMNLKECHEGDNMVVTTGKMFISQRMSGTSAAVMSHIAIGTSSVKPILSDTALGTEISRVAISSSTPSGAGTITYVASFPAGTGIGVLREAAIFNAASAGTMLAKIVFGTINKSNADSLVITWIISFA